MSSQSEIQYLTHVEGIRARPAMYVGSRGPIGIHFLITVVIDRSIDKLESEDASELSVTLHQDGSITILDDSGILANGCNEVSPNFVKQLIEGEQAAYHRLPPAGLHAVLEWTVMHALGATCEINLVRDGIAVRMKSERGNILALEQTATTETNSETRYRWSPDPNIFFQSGIHGPMLRDRLRELSYLHPRCRIRWTDETANVSENFQHPEGIVDLVRKLVGNSESPLAEPVCLRTTGDLRALLTDDVGLTGQNLRQQALRGHDQTDWLVFADYLEEQGDPRVSLIRSTWMPALESQKPKASGIVARPEAEETTHIEIAFQPTYRKVSRIHSFVNDHATVRQGTHVTGFLEGLTRSANHFARASQLLTQDAPKGDRYRDGMTAVVSLRILDPVFEGATRDRLANPPVRNEVRQFTMRGLKSLFLARPDLGTALVKHALRADFK